MENCKNHKKVILFNSTLTVRRCDGEWYHLFVIFAVFDVLYIYLTVYALHGSNYCSLVVASLMQ